MTNNKEIGISQPDLMSADFLSTEVLAKKPLGISSLDSIASVQPKNYLTAIDFISAQSKKLNAVTNQINCLGSTVYQPSILTNASDLKNQVSALSAIQSYLPKIDHLISVSPIIEKSRQASLAISGLFTPSAITEFVTSVATNPQSWYKETITPSILSASGNSTLKWAETGINLAELTGYQALSTLAIQSSIAKATEYSIFAEKSLCTITSHNLGSRLGLTGEPKEYLASTFLGFSDGYSTLLKSFGDNPNSYARINPSISKIVPSEYFSGANLLEIISVEEDITTEEELLKKEIQYDNEVSLSTYLQMLDARFYKMWRGAIKAYNSNNPDRIRHFSISIRELFTHILHKLAPDGVLKKWSNNQEYYDDKGKPTRKSRLLFICRNIDNDPFSKFVKRDVDSTIAFIDIFQKGTHDIDPIFSHSQLVAIRNKAESTLKFLLELHFSARDIIV